MLSADGIEEVLVVEDDAGDAFLAIEYIREQSADRVRTAHASSLAEALELLGPSTSCVLLDLNLPDADGMSALQAVLDAAPTAPIVVLTGLSGGPIGRAALKAGAQDYLDKNEITASSLWRAIRFAVERRASVDREQALLQAGLRRDENRRLARGLLPTPQLRAADLAWASRYVPANAGALLGGDFVDAIELADGTVRAVVGDVCGHGPEEAALGACLRIGWRALVLGDVGQHDMIRHIERLLDVERQDPSLFVTLCDLSIDPTHRRVEVVSAGHEAPLLISDGHVHQPEIDHGPLLGLGLGPHRPTIVDLPDAWQLLLFTDGIFEGRAGAGRLGVGGFVELVTRTMPLTDEPALSRLIAGAELDNGGPLEDDVALFALSGAALR